MLVLDVNVVLAAQRADHPHHPLIRPWFDHLVNGEIEQHDEFGVPSTVWASLLRLTTNRRILPVPTPLDEAFAFIEATTAQPRCLPTEPGDRHLTLVRRLCAEADATGDLVPGAVIGAIAVEHGATVATMDRDFARFDSVDHLLLR
ncbi:MAG: type II toxin-antitoxin system VapC family toxin [Actinomycetota bacterium]|nr:type II toxin-antitoxin system VapC family toxin [Actinomycetota bacterium]